MGLSSYFKEFLLVLYERIFWSTTRIHSCPPWEDLLAITRKTSGPIREVLQVFSKKISVRRPSCPFQKRLLVSSNEISGPLRENLIYLHKKIPSRSPFDSLRGNLLGLYESTVWSFTKWPSGHLLNDLLNLIGRPSCPFREDLLILHRKSFWSYPRTHLHLW